MSQPISLDQFQIREPCHESWDRMHDVGGGRRHCDSCVKSVHDFSAMSRADVERLLSRPGERPCVRFARSQDGRVLTREDFAPPSIPARRSWLRRVAAVAATLGFGSLFNFGCDRVQSEPVFVTGGIAPTTMPSTAPIYPGQAFMGDIATTEPVKGMAAPSTQPDAPKMGEPVMGATAPVPEPTHIKGKLAPPSTRPSNDPNLAGQTVGIISKSPLPKLPPAKTKAATPKRGRPS